MRNSLQFILILVWYISLVFTIKVQDLGGQWVVKQSNVTGEKAITAPATVPGGIYSDLMANGLIGDIFYGMGDANYSWVALTNWTYIRNFTIDEELLSKENVNLVFEGLDTFATIYLNGEKVGESQNMFVRYVFNVKGQLKVGSNEISVAFLSPVSKAAQLADPSVNNYTIPPECPVPDYKGVCHVNRIRKMQASFAWDWGPAFPSVGIWRQVYLQAFNMATIDYILATPTKNFDNWDLEVTIYFGHGEKTEISGTIGMILVTDSIHLNVSGPVNQTVDENGEISMTIVLGVDANKVQTWWPNGYGAQPLYNLTIVFSNEQERDEKQIKIGFREIELIQEEEDKGLSFYFKVNGQAIFAKGANEIPLNILPERGQNTNLIRKVLQTARDVNMNMLRVWGGGVYESDDFYAIADEYGILIWQDFMFACALYPSNPEYLSNVVAEVRHQVRRLYSHPSVVIWSGNNENEGALRDNWYNTHDNFTLYKNDYVKLYIDTIRKELLSITPKAIFITSSPTNGLESDKEGYVAEHPGDPLYGDVHFYDYKSDSWSFETFPIPRFASEYGYQSMPSIDSWLTVTDNFDDLFPGSTFMDHRQHHPNGNQENIALIEKQLILPQDSNVNFTKAFIFYSQIVQAEAIKIETEHYRSFKGRLNGEGKGNTMGALYWQLNDVWVAPTWSGMDFTGRWKMLQYFSKTFFAPSIVTGKLSFDQLKIYAITDLLEISNNSIMHVMMHVYKWNSFDPLATFKYPITLNPLKAVEVVTVNTSDLLNDVACSRANCFLHLHLMDEEMNNLAPLNYVFLDSLTSSEIVNANVQISAITSLTEENEFEITITTDAVALYVWLDSHEIMGIFSENGFLQVTPIKKINFIPEQAITLNELKEALTVTHLRDPIYLNTEMPDIKSG